MKALVIGDDACAHALAWKLAQSPAATLVCIAPGNYGANLVGALVNIPLTDPEDLAAWAAEAKIDLTVVASPLSLAYGVVDAFRARELRIVGPTQAAARLEGDPFWARSFLARHEIPALPSWECATPEEARSCLATIPDDAFPLLIRAIRPPGTMHGGLGLEAAPDRHGVLAVDRAGVESVLRRMQETERRGPPPRLLLMSYPEGTAISFLAIIDGTTTLPLGGVQVYRRAEDGERGSLTGGMGACAPAPALGEADAAWIMDRVITPTLRGLHEEGVPYQGVLTADLMLTPAGPRLVGFRTRFAEPEVTALLPRWEDDLYVILDAAADTALGELAPLRWSGDAVCSVVLASAGYPDAYETGYGVLGLGDVGHGALAFHNHTRDPYHKPEYLLVEKIDLSARKVSRGMGFGSWLWPSRDRGKRLDRQATRAAGDPYSQIVTSGGRVLMVVGRGRSLAEARAAAYRAAESVVFTGRTYRDDIGAADPIRSAR